MPEFAWLTRKQAAERAQLSERTIARAIAVGDLPAFRVGAGRKLWRLRPSDVDAWIAGENTPAIYQPQTNEERDQAARPVALVNSSREKARPDAHDNTRPN